MKNICRPFVIYNDFLPPSEKVHSNRDYFSFGYVDGITIGNNLFIDDSYDLNKLWEYYVKKSAELEGQYSSQIILGLRSEKDNEEIICDEAFWTESNKREYPYLFISLIQAEKENILSSWHSSRELEQALSEDDKRKAITYTTFDNSDMLLVLLCKEYYDGAAVLDRFHRQTVNEFTERMKWKLKYSFSIASVYKQILNDGESLQRITGNVERAYIYLIEKEAGSIESIYNVIRDALLEDSCRKEKLSVLGCNDEVIILEEVPWSRFLLLFQDRRGILNHSHEKYSKCLTGVTTIIGGKQEPVSLGEHPGGKEDSGRRLLSESMRKKCGNMKLMSDKGIGDISAIQRNLYQVINSLQKFEETPFHDYLFQTALLPLNMMIDMEKEVKYPAQVQDYVVSFYDFMKGFALYVQDTDRSDRQFTQTPDFNVRIYDTPVKINAFYNAFIYNVKEYLNSLDSSAEMNPAEDKHKYEFLACPGITNNMHVQEYFAEVSENKRLFLVEIPENQVYKLKDMLIMLTHEVAHFVGRDIRSREARYQHTLCIAAKIVVRYLQKQLNRLKQNAISKKVFEKIQDAGYWTDAEKKITDHLNKSHDENKDLFLEKFELENDGEREFLEMCWDRRAYHSDMVQKFLTDRIGDVLTDEKTDFWGYLLETDYFYRLMTDFQMAEKIKTDLSKEISKMVAEACSISVWNENVFSIFSALKTLMYLFRECFADLMCIMTLKLTLKEYLSTIIGNIDNEEEDVDFSGTDILVRSSLVVNCMNYPVKQENDWIWEDDQFREVEDWGSIGSLKNCICNFMNRFLKEEEGTSAEIKQVLDIFYDSDILELITAYLLKCKRKFAEFHNQGENSRRNDIRNRLLDIYQLFAAGDNVEKLALEMQMYVEEYVREIQQQNGIYAEEGSGEC